MAMLPHFSEGRYGKLTADVLNTIVEAVNDLEVRIDNKDQASVTQNAPAFPFKVRLKEAVYDANNNLLGYEWEEIVQNELGQASAQGRKYEKIEGKPDPPLALPVAGNGTVIRSGQQGLVFHGNLRSGDPEKDGRAYLSFIADTRDQGTFIGRIESDPAPLGGDGAQLYEIKKISFNGEGEPIVDENAQSFFGWNGAELYNSGDGGGSISGTGDCDPIVIPVTLPRNAVVVCVDVTVLGSGNNICVFNQLNDVQVFCNCFNSLPDSEGAEGYSETVNRDRDDDEPYYGTSMEGAMQ